MQKFGDDKGQAFFDKIIQVPFNMPIATNNFDKFMDKLTDNIIDNIGDNVETEKYPNCIKKLVNSR